MEAIRDALDFSDFPRSERIGFGLFSIFLLICPVFITSSFGRAVMIQFLLFSLYGMGWNSIGGYGGQVALGKAQYVGIAAYTVAMLQILWDIPFWFSMPVGVLLAVTWSFIVGYPLFRLRGHYFAIATIAVSLVLADLVRHWDFVGGVRGISIPFKKTPNFLYMQFVNDIYYYYFMLFFFMCGLFYMNWYRKSRLGFQLRAIKANEDVAASMGINVRWAKVKAYTIASAFVAVGGGFHAVYHLYIDTASVMQLDLSILIALMAMLGGAASLWGPIIGAAILVPLDRYLGAWIGGVQSLLGLDLIIYSLIIMLIAYVEPRGIWGLVERAREKRQ
jgi:branched-chain amino acid transport system permease protein